MLIKVTFRNFPIVVGTCMAASICLALIALVAPKAPLLPVILANWILWMVVAVGFRRSKVEWISYAQSMWWERLTKLAMITFAAAGIFAFSFSERFAY